LRRSHPHGEKMLSPKQAKGEGRLLGKIKKRERAILQEKGPFTYHPKSNLERKK